MHDLLIVDTSAETIQNYSMCGYKNLKQEGYQRKIAWIKERFKEGMKYKMLVSEKQGAVGGIEYIPGENAWRPVEAKGYMFIHCIFIMPKGIKNQGYGSMLLRSCEDDARNSGMGGVAVVTRKGTWMAGKEIFVKNGYQVSDRAEPDFELMVRKFNNNLLNPSFNPSLKSPLGPGEKKLVIYTSDQCPYAVKAIKEISRTAVEEFKIEPAIIEMQSAREAQNSPCAFGTFCIVFDGKIVADHPVSNTRFKNIMNKLALKS